MQFEWDENKARSNKAKHGVDFESAFSFDFAHDLCAGSREIVAQMCRKPRPRPSPIAFHRCFRDAQHIGNFFNIQAGEESEFDNAVLPLIDLTKAQIIRKGLALGVDYGLTSSCYDPGASGQPCGQCDSCILRQKGFREAGATDPLPYPDVQVHG